MTIQQAETTAQEVMYLYYKFGAADYIGEPVSQIEHMSQSAELAIEEGFDDEVILAAFFHDIGHICVMQDTTNSMGGFGIKRHEQIGADFLRSKGFSERLARLVENHVQAKRYLTYQYPEYYHALSEASKETLTYQGGPMTQEEAQEFVNDPLFEPSIQLRRWDELAKETNMPIIDLDVIKSKIIRILTSPEAE
ncbi:MAG TPA: HDIG domain-containing protein [Cyclobacteriaceae bacterium]|nr:phosphohydrolase [Cytophagales bacterium]HNP79098.1 HDIG domain-containing protein [Cyclobacteriaceae bacterium]